MAYQAYLRHGTYLNIKRWHYTKKIAIANKESIICGWDLIEKQLEKYKTKFVPVDSEHFSIWYALNNTDKNLIDKEMEIIKEELKSLGKPKEITEKISLGKINKFKEDNNLIIENL